MTQALRVAAQTLIDALDALDAKINDVVPYEQVVDLRAALSAPQPTADERVAEHMRLVESYAKRAVMRHIDCSNGIMESMRKQDDELAAVEQSARALLSASQEDAEHAAMYRWLREKRKAHAMRDRLTYLFDFGHWCNTHEELDAAIRSAMKEKKA